MIVSIYNLDTDNADSISVELLDDTNSSTADSQAANWIIYLYIILSVIGGSFVLVLIVVIIKQHLSPE
jgi:hypothetical protein